MLLSSKCELHKILLHTCISNCLTFLHELLQLVQLAHLPDLVTHHALIVHPTLTPRQEQRHVTAMPTTTRLLIEPVSLVHPTQPLILAQKYVLVCLVITESVEKVHLTHAQVRHYAV